MVRQLVLAAAALALAACAGGRVEHTPQGPRAAIGGGVEIALPRAPGYPEPTTMSQVLRARYGLRSATLESVLSLNAERVEIVLTVAGGPRIATVTWSEAGIEAQRTPFTPPDVAVENVMADIFLAFWPEQQVRNSLPAGVALTVNDAGGREIRRGEEVIVSIAPDPEVEGRLLVRNEALNYDIAITSQAIE